MYLEFTEGRHWVLIWGGRALYSFTYFLDLGAGQQFDQAFENLSSGAMLEERNGQKKRKNTNKQCSSLWPFAAKLNSSIKITKLAKCLQLVDSFAETVEKVELCV